MAADIQAAARAIDAFLRALGRDPSSDPDLDGTGLRVAEAFANDLCSGYAVDTRALLYGSVIAQASGELVVAHDLPVVTMCPHHLLPAMGKATIAMKVKERLVGVGTIASLVDAHARRLTLQERIGTSVVRDLETVLEPEWVGCRISLVHACMVARGERAVGSTIETIATSSDLGHKQLAMVHQVLGVGR